MKPSPYHGLLVVDKPAGKTSRDVVDRALTWFPRGTRIGHTGTLDPLATGVLVLCVGAATRLTEYVQDMDKTYRAGLLLGARSDTDDADGTVTLVPVGRPPERADVEAKLRVFVGAIDQVPPAFSAAKVTGRRAYDLARRGEDVSLQPRRVQIYGIEVRAYEFPRLELEVRCGKGTYIRSLARDLGDRLGCGALVQTLRRTRVGPFEANDGLPLDGDAEMARSRLLPLSAAVPGMRKVTLPAQAVAQLRRGGMLRLNDPLLCDITFSSDSEVAVFNLDNIFVLIARADPRQGVLRPSKVLMS